MPSYTFAIIFQWKLKRQRVNFLISHIHILINLRVCS